MYILQDRKAKRRYICIMYYIPSIHSNIAVQLYNIYSQVTLRVQVSTVNGHLQAIKEHF